MKAENKKTDKKETLLEKTESISSGFKSSYLILFIIFVVISLSFVAYKRNAAWKDDLQLWGDVIGKSLNKARGYNNLGMTYYEQGQSNEAFKAYMTALRLKPDIPHVHYNLGLFYQEQGKLYKAIEEYRIVLQLKPDYPDAHNNLGNVYANQGQMDEAIKEFLTALKLGLNNAALHYNMGNAYKRQDLNEEAIREFELALKLRPDFSPAHEAIESLRRKFQTP